MISGIYSKNLILRQLCTTYRSARLRGCVALIREALYGRFLYGTYPVHKYFINNRNSTFQFNGKHYRYCTDAYNLAWRNERTVEIPIVTDLIETRADKNILEIGNVLSHYVKGMGSRVVVDLYEKSKGVVNVDINKYLPKHLFDLIVSVSTMEHIGLDDGRNDPQKAGNAIQHCVDTCLAPNGLMVITVPIGYNKHLDWAINENRLNFDEKYYLARTKNNAWEEVPGSAAIQKSYGNLLTGANALFIGIIRKKITELQKHPE